MDSFKNSIKPPLEFSERTSLNVSGEKETNNVDPGAWHAEQIKTKEPEAVANGISLKKPGNSRTDDPAAGPSKPHSEQKTDQPSRKVKHLWPPSGDPGDKPAVPQKPFVRKGNPIYATPSLSQETGKGKC
jgi:hypothetical protein